LVLSEQRNGEDIIMYLQPVYKMVAITSNEMYGNRRTKIFVATLSPVAVKIKNVDNNPNYCKEMCSNLRAKIFVVYYPLSQPILCCCNAESGVNLVVQYLINILTNND